MYGEDERTREELVDTLKTLPALTCRQDRRGRDVWEYRTIGVDGKPGAATDAKTLHVEASVGKELSQAFRMMRVEDYIPSLLLDGPRGRGNLRVDATKPIPHWEAKYWERKYAIAYALGGNRHFEVNDAWKPGLDPGGYFDLRRACKLAISRLDADERVAAVDADDDGLDERDEEPVVEAVGSTKRRGRGRPRVHAATDTGPGSQAPE